MIKKIHSSHSRLCWIALTLLVALVTAAIVVFVEESTSSCSGGGEEAAPIYNGSRVTDSLKLVITVSFNLVKFVRVTLDTMIHTSFRLLGMENYLFQLIIYLKHFNWDSIRVITRIAKGNTLYLKICFK